MAAGLGFKDFVTGEVLTAADVDGYLMQGVWVFASAAARDAAVTSPQEGNFAYLKDTNVTTYYTGSAWANLDTTGMTNPMTTTGDIIYSSPGSTPVRLGIGTAGQVLKVNSGATAPEWGAASGAASWVGCVLTNSAAQSIANNTYTALTFNTESLDTDGFHSTSTNTNRITIPAGKAGKYLITVMATFTANAVGSRELFLLVNDTSPSGTATRFSTEDQPNASFNSSLVGSLVLDLTVGDYVNASVYQASGGALNIFGNNANPGMLNMTATYLGA